MAERGQLAEALTLYDEALARARNDPSTPAAGEVLTAALLNAALFNKATTLAELGQPDAAITTYDELITHHSSRGGEASAVQQSDPDTTGALPVVLNARYNKAAILAELGRPVEAIAVYDEVIAGYHHNPRPELREVATASCLNKAATLARQGQPVEAIAVYDELLARPDDPRCGHQIAAAGVSRAILLTELGRPVEALTAYTEVIDRHDHTEPDTEPDIEPEVELRWPVTVARSKRAAVLATLDRAAEALTAYDEVIDRHADTDEPALREEVLAAWLAKGELLEQLDRPVEALAVYDAAAASYTRRPHQRLRESAARALHRKSAVLERLGRPTEAVAAYDHGTRL
jgi:tetratricopeptide (TPR) repeat protein